MFKRCVFVALVATVVIVPGLPANALPVFVPPVDGPVLVRFAVPAHRFAAGHRGIDLGVTAGTQIRAAAAGIVTFAGSVGSTNAVTIAHGAGLESTYSHLQEISVRRGESVGEGRWIGRTGTAHPGGIEGLHFGVKLDDRYVDPQALMGAFDVGDAIHLAPTVWQPPAALPVAFRSGFADAGTSAAPCRQTTALSGRPPTAPTDNIAVAIAGINSSTQGGVRADMYEHGPEELGYPESRIYRFSYAGTRGLRLHEPYRSPQTFGDIEEAARSLGDLLAEIRMRHPGVRIDLIAHSMGGLVARSYLTSAAKEQRGHLPQVEHLVTFATPHQGASMAEVAPALEERTLSGRFVVDAASWWAQRGGPVPDPHSDAVAQIRPGSSFLTDLGSESVIYGTRALTLAIPNDVVVTADKASWPEATARSVPPAGVHGHSSIVWSDHAQGIAHAFLRDAAPSCEGAWDLWGPRIGRTIGAVEEQAFRAVSAVEQATLARVLRVGRAVNTFTRGRGSELVTKALTKGVGKLIHGTATRWFARDPQT